MLSSVIISIGIFIVTTVVSFFELKRLRLSWKFRHVPSVREIPILGCGLFFTAFKMTEFKRYIKELVIAPVCKLFIGPLPIFIVSDPDVIQEIANSTACLERPFYMRFFPYTKGILSCEYKYWKKIRRAVNPAFSQRAAISMIPMVNRHYKTYQDKLADLVGGPAFDLTEIAMHIAYKQMVASTSDNIDIVNQVPHHVYNTTVDTCLERARRPYLYPDFIYNLSSLRGKVDKLAEKIDAGYIPFVKHQLEQSDTMGFNFVEMMKREMKTGEKLTFQEIYDNVIILIVSGYETSALSVAYTCLMLAMHPEIDAKVQVELQENYHPGDEVDYELLKRLPYLDMVFKETLRLFPPVPVMPRETLEDVELKGIGLVPKGSMVVQVFYALHRWKKVWGEDADVFNPDHFLPEAMEKRHPAAFMPFGGGPRICIGYQHALINIKLALVHILSKYKFSTELKIEELTFKFAMTLHLNQKHMVKVHLRD